MPPGLFRTGRKRSEPELEFGGSIIHQPGAHRQQASEPELSEQLKSQAAVCICEHVYIFPGRESITLTTFLRDLITLKKLRITILQGYGW